MRLFHQRYHICPTHLMAEEVLRKGTLQRFCQQCGRFHDLDLFAPGMRSCRQQLARHAERRRRGRAMAAAAATSSGTATPPAVAANSTDLQLLATTGNVSSDRAEGSPTGQHEQQPAPSTDVRQGRSLRHHTQLTQQSNELKPPAQPWLQDQQGRSPRREVGSSGSNASAHSTHQQQRPHQQLQDPDTGGLDALLAATAEEEGWAEEEKQVQKRTRVAAEGATQPDLSWFQPQSQAAPQLEPAGDGANGAADAASSLPAASAAHGACSSAVSGWPVHAHAHAKVPLHLQPCWDAASQAAQTSLLRSQPVLEQQAPRADLELLLQHLVAAPQPASLPLAQPLATLWPPAPQAPAQVQQPALPTLAALLSVLHQAQQQQQQQWQQDAHVRQQLLLSQQAPAQEARTTQLFQAAVGGILHSLLHNVQ